MCDIHGSKRWNRSGGYKAGHRWRSWERGKTRDVHIIVFNILNCCTVLLRWSSIQGHNSYTFLAFLGSLGLGLLTIPVSKDHFGRKAVCKLKKTGHQLRHSQLTPGHTSVLPMNSNPSLSSPDSELVTEDLDSLLLSKKSPSSWSKISSTLRRSKWWTVLTCVAYIEHEEEGEYFLHLSFVVPLLQGDTSAPCQCGSDHNQEWVENHLQIPS